jgi:glycosyltransferase involved in cell wall biosynthesis
MKRKVSFTARESVWTTFSGRPFTARLSQYWKKDRKNATEQKMRIVVNGRFSHRKTGVGRVIENLFLQLERIDAGNEYFLYVNREFGDFIRFKNPKFHLLSNGVPAGNSLLNHIWTQTVFLREIHRHKADVVILPQINLFVIKMAPTILFQHDLIEYYLPNQKWYKRLFRKIAYPLALRLSDRTVCVSENTRADFEKIFNVRDEKLEVIPNGVDTALFRKIDTTKAKNVVDSKYGVKDDFILYAGTLTLPQKNLVRLVEAYDMMVRKGAKHKLVLVGSNGKDAHLISRKVKELGLAERVIFAGYVPDEDLPYFYNAATVFCFPSLYEGFGLPVLEAMACGCPVVTSNTSSLPEVAGDAAIFVNPLEVGEIAAAMLSLIENRRLRDDYGKRGMQRAWQFPWRGSAEKMLTVIRTLK